MEQKTISELWRDLQQLNISISLDEWTIEHPNHFTRPLVLDQIEKRNAIRQQLLELARLVKDAEGFCTRFEIYTEQGVPNPKTYLHAIGGTRFDTQETAANYIAAYAFWAWELEQRQKQH